jgi:hypothetical protein
MMRAFHLACLPVLLVVFVHSQASQAPATVTFTFDFPGSQPEHYSLQVESSGKGHYESSGKWAPDSGESDSFSCPFVLSAAMSQRVFLLTAKANYFRKDLDSRRKGLAFTGKKTLSYKDAQRSGESSYNYSPDPAVVEMTSLFQGLSATLEFGHRLDYDHRYQKLALDQETKHLEEEARSGAVVELPAIAAILREIVDDASVINVTRARAQRILEQAGVR